MCQILLSLFHTHTHTRARATYVQQEYLFSSRSHVSRLELQKFALQSTENPKVALVESVRCTCVEPIVITLKHCRIDKAKRLAKCIFHKAVFPTTMTEYVAFLYKRLFVGDIEVRTNNSAPWPRPSRNHAIDEVTE